MKSRVLTKNKSKAGSIDQIEYQEMMGTLGTAGAIPVLCGLWAAACLIGGMIASGGPLAMVRQFFTAITGY